MEESNSNGVSKFVKFVRDIPEESTNFDYFGLLDHFSNSKIDKDLIAAIFCESKY